MSPMSSQIAAQAVAFVERFFKVYLEDRDFPIVMSMLCRDVSWIGTGEFEICRDYTNAISLMNAERDAWDGRFKILSQWYEAAPIDDRFCVVYGQIKMIEDGLNTFLMDMDSRVSMVCRRDNGEFKLYHSHFSVPNAAQEEGEFVHKKLAGEYNLKLEKKLVERTELLKGKSFELETITNNIQAAIVRCDLTPDLKIYYANDGFFRMVGYTREQFEQECGNSLTRMVYSGDNKHAENVIKSTAENSNNGVTDIGRVVSRDGRVIWVLTNGTMVKAAGGEYEFHGVMTDITAQKEIEEALRISEKRYEVAMGFSDITMFEYNVVTRELTLFEKDANMYGVPMLLPNGSESLIENGNIEPECVGVYREMYREIHAGAPKARCYVNARGRDGMVHEFELTMTNILDESGRPIRAIGVRKNVTQLRQLEKEREYGSVMALNQRLIYEVNVTRDKVISVDTAWADEYGVTEITSFEELKRVIGETAIAPEDRDELGRGVSKEAIEAAYKSGQKLVSLEYRKRVSGGEYHWFRKNVNIIKDPATGDTSIRCYITDIDGVRQKEQKLADEQRHYETMISKSLVIFTANITKDIVLTGQEKLIGHVDVDRPRSFAYTLDKIIKGMVHPDDRDSVFALYSRENILNAYADGERELITEYRQTHKGGFIWVKNTAHLFEEPESGCIKAFFYIENINESKLAALDILYKSEHDLLTGLYNKTATEKKITEFLASSDGIAGKHAFFILDIDFFKATNDHFGHAFGDAVLSRTGEKLRDMFRETDIIGRIGGDEFVMLMKNIQSEKTATAKAQEVCDCIADSFTKDGTSYHLSASIGIAFYSSHGKSYDELYKNSDTALYISKETGRNRYTVYNGDMNAIELGKNEIIPGVFLHEKTFAESSTEYVFRILYESEDKTSAINAVLELVGKHYDTSRAYIFELIEGGRRGINTFEWCAPGVLSYRGYENDSQFLNSRVEAGRFNEFGVYLMPDIKRMEPRVQELLEPLNVLSSLQFSIRKGGEFRGFIGFDECRFERVPSKKEIFELQNISNMLGVFISEMRSAQETIGMKNMVMSIINGLDSYAYVCSPTTYRILFLNDKTARISENAEVGRHCYEAIWNRSTPCERCPMKKLIGDDLSICTVELRNSNLGRNVMATASWIDWIDGERVCLVDSVDISKYEAELERERATADSGISC